MALFGRISTMMVITNKMVMSLITYTVTLLISTVSNPACAESAGASSIATCRSMVAGRSAAIVRRAVGSSRSRCGMGSPSRAKTRREHRNGQQTQPSDPVEGDDDQQAGEGANRIESATAAATEPFPCDPVGLDGFQASVVDRP
jgi:hypothetical protein